MVKRIVKIFSFVAGVRAAANPSYLFLPGGLRHGGHSNH
jgi:hypothetical protein